MLKTFIPPHTYPIDPASALIIHSIDCVSYFLFSKRAYLISCCQILINNFNRFHFWYIYFEHLFYPIMFILHSYGLINTFPCVGYSFIINVLIKIFGLRSFSLLEDVCEFGLFIITHLLNSTPDQLPVYTFTMYYSN